MINITDIEDERIIEFKSLRDNLLNKRGIILAESEKVVLKLLNSDKKIFKLFTTNEHFEKYQDLIVKKQCEVLISSKEVMEQIVGFKLHHGIMATVERPKYESLSNLDNKILILNGLTSPENVGTMIRNAAAFNVNSIIFDYKTCSPYLRRCVRVSMGNIFNVKVHLTQNLVDTINTLKENGYTVYSTANEDGAIDLPGHKFEEKSCIIIGSEGHGIEQRVKENSSSIIRIPINDTVAHLNAACSSSIFLYNLVQ
ncbi:RNA methyltransferase [Halobacteriovorax sp. GB3]|uniref:TrmH family RNA methyltransferase n=1 Tax=Halobacteriovorax sp. GB3 TaxID=2719615 RepID=UPI002360536E|nr:RNA methyltransferase [Halobacteriovorax sp. GB3]MDD0854712.1 RNA methyltransferase [Halobacteriovorax sp. GB3]